MPFLPNSSSTVCLCAGGILVDPFLTVFFLEVRAEPRALRLATTELKPQPPIFDFLKQPSTFEVTQVFMV